MENRFAGVVRDARYPLPVAFNMIVYAARFLFAGQKECTDALESMLRLAKENAARNLSGLSNGKEKLRAFFCYIDHYTQNLRLWQMLDKHGICYEGNILSRSWSANAPHVSEFGTQDAAYKIDTSSVDSMIDSMSALNSINFCLIETIVSSLVTLIKS